MKILLVGTYPGDRPGSMDRFASMLLRGLREEGIDAEMIQPAVMLGRLARSGPAAKWLAYIDRFVLFRGPLRKAARAGCIVHITDQGNAIWAGSLPGAVVTCHDLLAIRSALGEFPQHRTGLSGRILSAHGNAGPETGARSRLRFERDAIRCAPARLRKLPHSKWH